MYWIFVTFPIKKRFFGFEKCGKFFHRYVQYQLRMPHDIAPITTHVVAVYKDINCYNVPTNNQC